MGQETIWTLEIDAGAAVASAEEIAASIDGIAESIAAVVSSAGDMSAIDESLSGIASISADAQSQIDGLTEAMASMASTIAEDTTIIDGLNETVANLEAQLAALTGEFESAGEGAGGLSSIFSSVQGTLGNVGDAFSGMLGSVGDGVSGVMGKVGDFVGGIGDVADSVFMGAFKFQIFAQMAVQAGQALFGPAEQAETMQTAFTTLTGSTQAATAELQQLDAFASKTPFKTMDIDQAAAQLQGFGINAKNVIPDLTAIGDALGAVGKGSTANLDGVVNILGKMQNTGHLTSAMMNELAARGIDAWSLLEQQTGKSHAALQKMISGGLYPADKAMQDLTKGIEASPLYSGGMAKQSQTAVGLLSTLKSNADQALAAFAGPLMKQAEGGLSGIANALASPGFKQFAAGVGASIAATFQNIGNFISTNVMPAVNEVVKGLESPGFKSFASGVGKDIEVVFQDIGNFIKNDVTPAIGGFIKFLESPSFASFSNSVRGIAQDVGQMLAPVLRIAGEIFQGLWHVIEQVWPPIANQLMPAVKHLADAISPLVTAIGDWIAKSGIIPGIFNAIGAVLGIVIGVIAGLINGVAAVIGWFGGLGNAVKAVGTFFGNLWKDIQSFFGAIGEWFHDRIQGVIDAFAWLYNHNYYFKDLVDFIHNVVGAVLDWLHSAWNAAVSWLGGLWHGLSGLAQNAWNGVVSVFEGVWGAISGALSSLWDSISGWFGNLAGQAVSWGSNLIQGFINGITSMLSAVGNAASNIAGKVAQFLGFHSPAELGPGAEADTWAPNFMRMFTQGIEASQERLRTAVHETAGILAGGLNPQISTALSASVQTPQGLPAPQGGLGGGNDKAMQYLQFLPQILAELQKQGRAGGGNNLTMNNSFASPQNIRQLAQAINSALGFAYESTNRGVG